MTRSELPQQRGAPPAEPHRGSSLRHVLRELTTRLRSGEPLDAEKIQRQYGSLIDGFGESARHLPMLLLARERARAGMRSSDSGHDRSGAEHDLELLRQSLEKYEVLECIRHGGQGVVYQARQRGTNRIVAIKVLLDGPLATARQQHRFQREIELISRLRHPNIVTVHESGIVRGRNFYVMEFVDGLAISDYAVLNDLRPRQIVALMIKVCAAVHHAHQNGVIHRDLNPANILVDERGEPRVYDFGLAKDLRAAGDDAVTHTGLGAGTLPYLSPEQAGSSDGGTDVRTDVYALGLILYELLTDTLPYSVLGDPAAVQERIRNAEPVPLRQALVGGGPDRALGLNEIDADLEAIAGRALAKAKADRYQSADGLAADLQHWLRGDAVTALADRRWYRVRKFVRKYRRPIAFAAVVAVAMAAVSVTVTISWLHARGQRDAARRAARLAFDLFDSTLTDVEEAVRPLPGGVAVRDDLVRRLAEKQGALALVVQDDPALEHVQTRLLEKQGDLALRQHGAAAARQYYEPFLKECLADLAEDSNDPAGWASAIRAYGQLASVSEAPLAIYEAGEALGRQAVQRFPGDELARFEHCRLLIGYGGRLRDDGRPQAALERYQRASDLCASRDSLGALRLNWTALAAQALHCEGMVLTELGHAKEGRFAVERALAIREGLLAERPSDTETRYALLRTYQHLGRMEFQRGNLQEAKRLLEKSVSHGNLLGLMDTLPPNWNSNRYAVSYSLVDVCIRLGQLDEAAVQVQRAVELAEKLAHATTDETAQATLHYARMLQAGIPRSAKDYEGALALYLPVLEQAEAQLARQPAARRAKERVADVSDCIALCENALGRPHEGVRLLQRALAIRREVAAAEPESIEGSLNLIQTMLRLGSTILNLETDEARRQACDLVEEADKALRQLNESGRLAGWERRRAHLEERIANLNGRLDPPTAGQAATQPGLVADMEANQAR